MYVLALNTFPEHFTLQENNSRHAVHCAVQAFKAAVAQVGKEEAEEPATYVVEGSSSA